MTLSLSGGGTLEKTIALGTNGTLQLASPTDFANQTTSLKVPYTVNRLNLTGAGTLTITGGKFANGFFSDPNVIIASKKLKLTPAIALSTAGGFISGPGTLVLGATANTIRNTRLDGVTLEVPNPAGLTFARSPNYDRNQQSSSWIYNGAKLIANGSTVTVNDADVYLGTNGAIQLNAVANPLNNQAPFLAYLVFQGTATTNGSIQTVVVDKVPQVPVGITVDSSKILNNNAAVKATVDVGDGTVLIKKGDQDFSKGSPGTTLFKKNVEVQGKDAASMATFTGDLVADGTSYESMGAGASTGNMELQWNLINSGAFSIAPGAANFLTIDHSFTQTAAGSLALSLGGVGDVAGRRSTAGHAYDQLAVNGGVALDGTLNLSALSGLAAVPGNSYTIIDNDSSAPTTGTFAGLPEGGTVNVTDALGHVHTFVITYHGGNGNDVVLRDAASVTVNAFNNSTPATVSFNDGAGHAGTDNTLLTQFNATYRDGSGASATFNTFCIDLAHNVSAGQTYLVYPGNLTTGFVNAGRIAYVFQTYGQGDLTSNPIQAAAVQLTIWDLELKNHSPTTFVLQADGSYSSGDSTVFDVRMDSTPLAAQIASLTNQYLQQSLGARTSGGWLDASAAGGAQNRGQSLLVPAPAPSPIPAAAPPSAAHAAPLSAAAPFTGLNLGGLPPDVLAQVIAGLQSHAKKGHGFGIPAGSAAEF